MCESLHLRCELSWNETAFEVNVENVSRNLVLLHVLFNDTEIICRDWLISV